MNVLTFDIEEWFHILDSPVVPLIGEWDVLESRIAKSLDTILQLLDETSTKATFFWLGWMAERYPGLLLRCHSNGHEIASHGYGHVLAYQVGRTVFAEDVSRSKKILEDIIGEEVRGFRAPGFGITEEARWAFDEIRKAGYSYDSSVFPTPRGHGGLECSPLIPYHIETEAGSLLELPMSVVEVGGKRLSMFGGGYLRFFPKRIIQLGIQSLHKAGRPLIVYLHPREIDPEHPRLPLPPFRKFKCYVNLDTTLPKLRWLCDTYQFQTAGELEVQYSL